MRIQNGNFITVFLNIIFSIFDFSISVKYFENMPEY